MLDGSTYAVTIPAAERRAGEYRNLVRYFNVDDQQAAAAVVTKVNAYFSDAGCPVGIAPDPQKSPLQAPLGHIEVWIAPSCQ